MQFRLRSLFILTAVVSVLCGLIFAAPPIVALPIFCLILWVCPAFWITGIVYGRGAWRPFFIGGVMAGVGPHLFSLYYSIMVATSLGNSHKLTEHFRICQWLGCCSAPALSPSLADGSGWESITPLNSRQASRRHLRRSLLTITS